MKNMVTFRERSDPFPWGEGGRALARSEEEWHNSPYKKQLLLQEVLTILPLSIVHSTHKISPFLFSH